MMLHIILLLGRVIGYRYECAKNNGWVGEGVL